MEIIKTTALITINETLWVQVIIFLAFLFLINRIMFRPVRRNLAEREPHFTALRQAIAALKSEMGALFKETEAEEKRMKTEAHRIGEELRQEGQQEANRLIDEALNAIKDHHQKAEHQIAADMAAARRQLETEASHLATSIIDHLMQTRS